MANTNDNNGKGSININDDAFYTFLGNYIKALRIKAGFPSPEAFANIIGMTRSQYSAYENGKNLTLLTFRNILLEFNIKVEEWLNIQLLDDLSSKANSDNSIQQIRIDQVIEQVVKLESREYANSLGSKEIQRFIDILIYCHTPKKRNEILAKLLQMDDSVNTLKRVAGNLLDYGWLELTDPINKNNPNQKYVTTERGKEVLRLKNNH